jgi:hypothetical protein
MNQRVQKKQKLWSIEGRAAFASLPLRPWTDRRRKDLLNLLAMLDAQLESLNDAVTRVAKEYPGVPHSYANSVSTASFIEGSVKCILVSGSQTDSLSRCPRTQ